MNEEVVVVASDTDILMLFMYHWQNDMELYIQSDMSLKKGLNNIWKIEDLVTSRGTLETSHLLFIHAWTGYDTTSAIYGQGKFSSYSISDKIIDCRIYI